MEVVEPVKSSELEEQESKKQDDTGTEPYNFPFKPYDIQLDLMKVAYEVYETGKFALLESPTGTGKSMSLICSALTWLRDHQKKVKEELDRKQHELTAKVEEMKKQEEESGDWLSIQTRRQDINRELVEVHKAIERMSKFDEIGEARRHAKLHNIPLENYSLLLRDVSNDKRKTLNCDLDSSILNNSQENIATQEDDEDIERKIKEQDIEQLKPKIFYASRTHSQLTQFINEVKRTKFANVNEGVPIRVAAIASRANLCVKPEVVKLRDGNAINERCMELQKETKSEKRCSYMKLKQVHMLKEDILSSVQDIEDIVSKGQAMGSCPYYATRMAIPEAELVVLPYNNLLHHETRKASSLDLKESVVIVDEAHNILETICSIHSASMTGQQLLGSHTILSRYYERFHNRMTPRNAETIKNIVHCLTALVRFLDEPQARMKEYDLNTPIKTTTSDQFSDSKNNHSDNKQSQLAPNEYMVDVLKFIHVAKLESYNIFKILDYFNRSQLVRKLIGFFKQDCTIDLAIDIGSIESNRVDGLDQSREESINRTPALKKRKSNDSEAIKVKPAKQVQHTDLKFLMKSDQAKQNFDLNQTSYPVYTLVEFLKCLTSLARDGKILTTHYANQIQRSCLKFVLLNPSSQFQQMTKEARSIILAGGTMQPFSEFIDLLFGPLGIKRDRLKLFSCDHVIRSNQLYASTLSVGPTGKPLELSYKTRGSYEAIDDIGKCLLRIATTAPGGLVCFLPSYEYEQICYNRWKQTGIISSIETKAKQVFREPRQTGHVKVILEEYSRVIEKGLNSTGRGAMLLCVVGGKMSEGINFNDDLGRCVVMVGLPYANIKSSELQERMAHYDRSCKSATNNNNGSLPSAGQQYYENLCIKGINQSIGRAVRHRNDYASIILLDRRYSAKASIKNGLPKWIQKSLAAHERFDLMQSELNAFFMSFKSADNDSARQSRGKAAVGVPALPAIAGSARSN